MINAAVVGYGYAGRAFHSYLIGLADGLRLYAISTRSAEHQRAAAQQHPEAQIYGSLDELLDDDQVDLVVIATPHYTHHDLAVQAMNAGKHVVVDKAMAMSGAEAADMIAAAERNQVMLSVFQNRRWDWDYLTVKNVIADGLLGEPYLFQIAVMEYYQPRGWRADKARSGGILYDWPAHFIDQALQLVPAAPKSVYCRTVDRDVWDATIENYAKLIIEFDGGVLYEIEVTNLGAVPKPHWTVLGSHGGLIKYGLDPQESAMRDGNIFAAEEAPEHRARVTTYAEGERQELVIDSVRGSWTGYYQNISAVLNTDAELAVKPEEVYEVMRIYDAAAVSAQTNTVISL